MSALGEAVTPDAGKGGWFWALVPVALLSASVVGVGTMASIAAHDPGFALEQNYYDRAVHWDRTQAQAAENARLGYRATADVVLHGDSAEIVVRLVDRAGAPLRRAELTALAFPNARAKDVQSLAFAERPDGGYGATLARARPGLWEVRLEAKSAGERFTDVVRVDVPRSSAP